MTPPLPDEHFAMMRDFLASAAGLAFGDNRRGALAAVLEDRLFATGVADVPAYVAALSSPGGERERERLLDAVTVQETHFFRNAPQVDALRGTILPALLARAGRRGRRLTIWSAGCSTGEEAYTLAMLLVEIAGAAPPARIVATDVSAAAVRTARQATYAGRTLATVPPTVRDRFFTPAPGGSFAVRDEVRRLVETTTQNLVTDPPPLGRGEVDLVVCRNVTIYFDRPTTRLLMGRFHDVLTPDGYLLLGHSETLWQLSDAFTVEPIGDAFVYRPAARTGRRRRPADPPAAAPRAHRLPRRRPRPVAAPPAVAATVDVRPKPALLDAAYAALSSGDYADAARLAEAACAAAPLQAEAYVLLGHVRSTVGADDAALDVLRKAVFLEPGHGIAYFLMGGALGRLGQHALATVAYRAAVETLPAQSAGDAEVYLGGRSLADLVGVCERLARTAGAHAAADEGVRMARGAP
jgi:chemotaxis protein methyltransferase CheR